MPSTQSDEVKHISLTQYNDNHLDININRRHISIDKKTTAYFIYYVIVYLCYYISNGFFAINELTIHSKQYLIHYILFFTICFSILVLFTIPIKLLLKIDFVSGYINIYISIILIEYIIKTSLLILFYHSYLYKYTILSVFSTTVLIFDIYTFYYIFNDVLVWK